MADFATLADIEAFLQLDIITPAQIASAQMALKDATAAIKNYCRQFLERVNGEIVTLDSPGGVRLFLPELPVLSVSSVMEDGELLTPGDDYALGQHGILHRVGATWATGIQIVAIAYSHGYAIIPDDIVAVCTRAASRQYQAGLAAADSGGIPGIASKSLGDFSVAYQSAAGGGTGEGVMGASAARLLLLSEKDVLNRYRI